MARVIPMEEIPDELFDEDQARAVDAFKKIERERQLPVLRIKTQASDPVLLDVEMEDRSHVRYIYDGLTQTVKEI